MNIQALVDKLSTYDPETDRYLGEWGPIVKLHKPLKRMPVCEHAGCLWIVAIMIYAIIIFFVGKTAGSKTIGLSGKSKLMKVR